MTNTTRYPDIALVGRQRAGKDTVADYLVSRYGYAKLPLAGPVYDIARKYHRMQGKNRALLVAIGQAHRAIDPDVWVKYLLSTIDEVEATLRRYQARHDMTPGRRPIVVSDVRMPNEAEALQARGFVLVAVDAPTETRSQRPGFDADREWDETELSAAELVRQVAHWSMADHERRKSYYMLNINTVRDLQSATDTMLANVTPRACSPDASHASPDGAGGTNGGSNVTLSTRDSSAPPTASGASQSNDCAQFCLNCVHLTLAGDHCGKCGNPLVRIVDADDITSEYRREACHCEPSQQSNECCSAAFAAHRSRSAD